MKTKLTMKWAAAVACITLALSARADNIIITGTLRDASMSVPDWTSLTQNWDISFAGTPMDSKMANWDVNTGIVMSFDVRFGQNSNQQWATESLFGFGIGNKATNGSGFTIYGSIDTGKDAAHTDKVMLRTGGNGQDPYANGGGNLVISSTTGLAKYSYTPYAVSLTITKIAVGEYLVAMHSPAGTDFSGVLTSAQLGAAENTSINTIAMRQIQAFNWSVDALNFKLNTFAVVPEPSTLFLLGVGGALLLVLRRRRS